MNPDDWQQAHAVFQAVLDLDDGERERTLDELGYERPDVAATVRALLEGHAMESGPFDRLGDALGGSAQGVEAGDGESDAWVLVGDPGARWRRIRELGRGGMGVVHLAEDASLGRLVAIKTLAADVAASPRARRRLLQEARTVAALDHPNIVPIHEVGLDDEESLFLVFGYTPGETLKARLQRDGRLSFDEALAVTLGVSRALAAAHARGVVHRDVKPSNVLVGEDGTVRLTDFGIARRPAARGRAAAFGTPAYMAPEALEGGAPDPRTDVWSLGIVLHEMLTGQRPGSEAETRAAPESPPGTDDSRRDALHAVVGRMIAIDPAHRFADGSETLAALERVCDGTAAAGVSAAPPRRTRVGHAGLLALGLTLVAAVVWAAVRDAPTLPAADAGSRGHVLWVDDDPSLSAAEEAALTRGGYRVTRALSTDEALQVFDPEAHTLVISDLGRVESGIYRDVAGLEMVRGLQARDPSVRIVFFTSGRALEVIESSPESAWVFGVTTSSAGLFDLVERASGGGVP